MEPFSHLESGTAFLLRDNVDTDQIVPARFLKGTTKEGLGKVLFADWRLDPSFSFDRGRAEVLVVGRNFGCGSSREHAVWALKDYGFRALIGLSFADIFRSNALQNGLLPISLREEAHARVGERVEIDLEALTVTLGDGTVETFAIEPFARYCLLRGKDALEFLVEQEGLISIFETGRME